MRIYTCTCGNTLYFDNTQCLQCGRTLGFDPLQLKIVSLESEGNGLFYAADDNGIKFRKCENYQTADVCNWLVESQDEEAFCVACRLNSVIPDLSTEVNRTRWLKLERAKRRLIYTLLTLHLPITSFKENPEHGLSFRFMQDITEINPFSNEVETYEQIMTGHQSGTITINIIEADDSVREKIKENMNESYRTILGHFRHEVGHYYWDKLIARTNQLNAFRDMFGDERHDYKTALTQYYENGPQANWMNNYISAYASAHPWEDWAETWAHYLLSIDILETASHHHIGIEGEAVIQPGHDIYDSLANQDFGLILDRLGSLTRTLNELNRSLGLSDPYPFELSPAVAEKLAFIHRLVMNH